MLKTKTMLDHVFVCIVMSYYLLVIVSVIYYLAVGLHNGRAKHRDELKNQSTIGALSCGGLHSFLVL